MKTFNDLQRTAPRTAAGVLSAYIHATAALQRARAAGAAEPVIVYEFSAPNVPQPTIDLFVRLLGVTVARYQTRICASALSPLRQDRYFFSNVPFLRPRPTAPTPTVESWITNIRSSVL